MRDRLAFIVVAILASVALFALLRWATGSMTDDAYAYAEGLFVIPVLAMILAARGWSIGRRLAFAAVISGGLAVGHVLAGAFDIPLVAGQGESFGAGVWSSLVTVTYHTFRLTFPLAAFLLFVKGEPTRLWSSG